MTTEKQIPLAFETKLLLEALEHRPDGSWIAPGFDTRRVKKLLAALASAQAQQESVPMDLRAKLDKLEFDAGAGRISAMALYTRMRDLCLAYATPIKHET